VVRIYRSSQYCDLPCFMRGFFIRIRAAESSVSNTIMTFGGSFRRKTMNWGHRFFGSDFVAPTLSIRPQSRPYLAAIIDKRPLNCRLLLFCYANHTKNSPDDCSRQDIDPCSITRLAPIVQLFRLRSYHVMLDPTIPAKFAFVTGHEFGEATFQSLLDLPEYGTG
jgi:hypothetical protein